MTPRRIRSLLLSMTFEYSGNVHTVWRRLWDEGKAEEAYDAAHAYLKAARNFGDPTHLVNAPILLGW